MTVTRIVLVSLIVATVAACAPWKHVKRDSDAAVSTRQFKATMPVGWTRFFERNHKDATHIVISRDGPAIHSIHLEWYRWGHALRGDPENWKLARADSTMEMAERISALVARLDGSDAFEVTSLAPATYGGHDGFRIDWESKTDNGLRTRGMVYGAMTENGFMMARYRSPVLHFYERDLEAFERVVPTVFETKQSKSMSAR